MPYAHGNGVDEAIMVLVPLIFLIVLLRIGAKKAPPEDEPDETGDAVPKAAPDAAPDAARDAAREGQQET